MSRLHVLLALRETVKKMEVQGHVVKGINYHYSKIIKVILNIKYSLPEIRSLSQNPIKKSKKNKMIKITKAEY